MATKTEIIDLVLKPLTAIFYSAYGADDEAKRIAFEGYIATLSEYTPDALDDVTKHIVATRVLKSLPVPAEVVELLSQRNSYHYNKIMKIQLCDRTVKQWRLILPRGKPSDWVLDKWDEKYGYQFGKHPEHPNTSIPDEILKEWGFR